jgi:hypothetical protein
MPENLVETDKRQIRLTKSLIEQLELIALTGMYGAQISDVIQVILSNEVRRMFASGEFSILRDRVRSYPAKGDDVKAEGKE